MGRDWRRFAMLLSPQIAKNLDGSVPMAVGVQFVPRLEYPRNSHRRRRRQPSV